MFEYQNLKAYIYFYFLNLLTHGSHFVEYIKVHQKNDMIWWTFDTEKKNWNKKTTCPHGFIECFKHIKGCLKHGEFSWQFCSCNFESIIIYLKN